jgi:GNAT superfamily N-acetyltransferase
VWPDMASGPDATASRSSPPRVVDDWQGRGIGRALTARIIERARANGMIRLTASALADNRPALALLRELGFRTSGHAHGVAELELERVPHPLLAPRRHRGNRGCRRHE